MVCFCWFQNEKNQILKSNVWVRQVSVFYTFLFCTVRNEHFSTQVVSFAVVNVVTGRMPQSGKLAGIVLLTGQKSAFSPRRGDSLH